MSKSTQNENAKYRSDVADKQITNSNTLVGSFFHSFHIKEDETKTLEFQGQVVAEIADGIFLLELYSAIDGSPSCQVLFRVEELIGERWEFYDTADWMKSVYESHHGWIDRNA